MRGGSITLGGFLYLAASIVGAAALQWYVPDCRPTAFWQVLVVMLAVVVWFMGAALANELTR
jgi:hypothetical protein